MLFTYSAFKMTARVSPDIIQMKRRNISSYSRCKNKFKNIITFASSVNISIQMTYNIKFY